MAPGRSCFSVALRPDLSVIVGLGLAFSRASTAPISSWQSSSTPCPTWRRARMSNQYRGKPGVRPHCVGQSDHGEAGSARFFLCVGCRAQSLICSCCDRGQIYCAGDCGPHARRRRQRAAGARYQASRRGRLAHAERARRYRARCKFVTHQGSPAPPDDDLLASGSPTIASDATTSDVVSWRPASHCHWCGQRCSDLVRQGFLRRRTRRALRHKRTGRDHGDVT